MKLRYRYISVQYGGKPAHLEQLQRGSWNWFLPMPHTHDQVWRPPTDVYETDDNVVIVMELAGVDDKDVEVTIFNDVVVVTGVRADGARPEKVRYHEMGISFGRFRGEVVLPMSVDPDCVEAHYENGLLTVTLPKRCQC